MMSVLTFDECCGLPQVQHVCSAVFSNREILVTRRGKKREKKKRIQENDTTSCTAVRQREREREAGQSGREICVTSF